MQIINVLLANSKIPDIPVKTEFPDIPWFSRKCEPC